MTWAPVLLACLGCYVLKAAGFAVPERILRRPQVQRVAAALPLALLAALIAIQTFARGSAVVIDARAAGLAVAIGCVALRAPFLIVVIAAAATTAGLRALP